MKDEELLAELEEIIRTMPPLDTLHTDTDHNLAWLGRLTAFQRLWDQVDILQLKWAIEELHSGYSAKINSAKRKIRMLLAQAENALRLKTIGPVNIAIGQGLVFQYFDELRKIIETAKSDLLFIDPYLEADFVSRYLPHVTAGVSIRLLTSQKLAALTPAVELFEKESGAKIQIRSTKELHDRHVIIDGSKCYSSGASFKDGAKTASTTLTQITDAFAAVQKTYEDLWTSGKVIR